MKIEYFLKELNGWLCITIEEYIDIIFRYEEERIKIIKSLKNIPIKILSDNKSSPEIMNKKNLISGNYVEVLMKKELNLISNKSKKLSISLQSNENKKRQYDIWVRAKIISYDNINDLMFLECDEELFLVEDMNNIRPLSKLKKLEEDIFIYYFKKLSSSEYVQFKFEYDNVKYQIEKENEEIQYLIYQNYNAIRSSLICVFPRKEIYNFPSLRELENKYKFQNIEESITNSGITSRSGRSEESDKNISRKSNIFIDEEYILNDINNHEFKKSFIFKTLFEKDAHKIMKNFIKKVKYFMAGIDGDEFKIILYGNKENDFNEEKNNFEKEFKSKEILIDTNINKNEIIDIANNAKVKYIYFGKKFIYLIGAEKSISNFEKIFNMNIMYSKEIEKSYKENENIQKQLTNFKKEYKLK